MPIVNLDGVKEASEGNFEPVPAGKYHVKAVDAELKTSSKGDKYINYKLEIFEGEHSGRFVWDSIFFTENAKSRLALVASRLLGIKPVGDITIEPEMFSGNTCWVEVVGDSYMKDGEEKRKNIVTFAGYLSDKDDDDQTPESTDDSDSLPF